MEHQVDSENSSRTEVTPIVYQGEGHAAVMMLVGDGAKSLVYDAASGGVARTLEAWHYTNILAIGCDVVVLDPTLLSEEEWDCLCEVYGSYVDVEFRMLLVKPSPYKATMPSRNVIHAPPVLTVQFLRDQMVRAARVPRSKTIWAKKERQIQRLMYMLHCLDTSTLRLRDVAERFGISLRTAQRDLEVLLMADYVILDGAEPGTYLFPKGYKAYNAFS